jgi:ABC-2 type transport system ATP-binding protein
MWQGPARRSFGDMTTLPDTNQLRPFALETDGLTKRFGERVVVDDVTVQVPRATAFGFLGHNGAGKTTLIRMLLGLTSATAGSARVLGLPVPARRREALARVGAIVEQPSFYPELSGVENLRVAGAVRGPEARTRIAGALARVGLVARAQERVGAYSLGMRQRLGLARCLLSDPELLILDEPMNGLDPGGMLEMRQMIRELVDEDGRTVFISSHLLGEIEKTCDNAVIIDKGKVIAQGTIAELVSDERRQLLIGCDDEGRARRALAEHPAVTQVDGGDGTGLLVTVIDDEHAGEINSWLVGAGVTVSRLEPRRHSLEERFLEMTTRLEEVKG